MRSQTIYQVDAFTDQPFKGNPAGVCIMDTRPSDEWMQNIAMEMNLSETAFVFIKENPIGIRFFTPAAEIDLCGHATLSSSHIIYASGILKTDQNIIFLSKAGELFIKKEGELITMNFPAYSLNEIKIPVGIEEIIGIKPLELYRTGHGWVLGLLRNEKELTELVPSFPLMKNSEFGDLILTAPSSDSNFDFSVRCFAPALGIDEDPVTGSAHCSLAPFWYKKTGKKNFISHQVSKRGGILKVSLIDDRVAISGKATTIFRADLFV